MDDNILNKLKMLGGLVNVGNTCWFNTALQCLCNVSHLNHYILIDKEIESDINKDSNEFDILIQFRQNLINLLQNKVVRPINLLKSINNYCRNKNISLHFGRQEDSHEFLLFILDWLHESIKCSAELTYDGNPKNNMDKLMIESFKSWKNDIENDYSKIIELFAGQYLYRVYSDSDKKEISHNFEKFISLSLDITEDTETLYDCIKNHNNTSFKGDEQYFYEKENTKIDATRVSFFWELPMYLIISLKRFNYDNTKNNKEIEVPIDNFDLSQFSDGYNKLKSVYNLISIGLHQGSTLGGHYFAVTRKDHDKWFLYNDESVDNISDINHFIKKFSDDIYYLIYQKVDRKTLKCDSKLISKKYNKIKNIKPPEDENQDEDESFLKNNEVELSEKELQILIENSKMNSQSSDEENELLKQLFNIDEYNQDISESLILDCDETSYHSDTSDIDFKSINPSDISDCDEID